MNEQQVRGLFALAGFDEPAKLRELANGYWPNAPAYAQIRQDSPWWLVETPFGPITIGWRKRVISIDWRECSFRGVITEDDVTKDDSMVHAWSYVKALDYLTKLRAGFKAAPPSEDASL